jgi:hypothetical protein
MMVAFDPERLLRRLIVGDVRFVLIGSVAGLFWGADILTPLLEICYEQTPANCDALANALTDVHAVHRGSFDDVPLADALRTAETLKLHTDAGDIDCLAAPPAVSGFEELRTTAAEVELGTAGVLLIARLDELIRMRRATGYAKDSYEAEILAGLKRPS